MSISSDDVLCDAQNFSVVLGGPLFQLLRRAHLADDHPRLARAKRTGLHERGTFAERYVGVFDVKWLRGSRPKDEALLGSGDIQSLADLSNSFAVVEGMRLAPIGKEAVIRLTIAVFAPIAPLLLTTMPIAVLVKKLLDLVAVSEVPACELTSHVVPRKPVSIHRSASSRRHRKESATSRKTSRSWDAV